MSKPKSLKDAHVAVLGLGLMGGSLAMRLKGRCRGLMGFDPQADAVKMALNMGAVDQASTAVEELLPQADVVILAAPVGAILEIIDQLPDLHPGEAVVMDIGSTKVHICQALEQLPTRFDPIGGHPMCGKETSGIENAEAGLFEGAVYALTPLPRTSEEAKSVAEEIVKAVNAHPLWLEPEVHDQWTAATSHTPYLLSIALTLATPAEAAPMIGPGFRSTSRLAGSSVSMMMDILRSNGKFVLGALENCQDQLNKIQDQLKQGDDTGLFELLSRGKAARENLLWDTHEETAS